MATTKPQIPVGFIKCAQEGLYGPSNWTNVFYLDATGAAGTPGAVIADAALYISKFYSVGFTLARLEDHWSTTWVTVTYRDASDSIVRLRVADAMAGTGTTGDQGAQVSYLVNWGTGDPRKGGKPRQYVCGVPDQALADSAFLSSSLVSAVNTNLITWLESGPAHSYGGTTALQLVEMSFRNGNTWRDTAATYPIIGGTLNPVVATQRRRVDRLRPS